MKKSKIKILLITGSIVILLFGIWNIVWLVMTNNRYDVFLDSIPKSKYGNHIIKKDNYVYNVSRPGYLSFTGNLGINDPEGGNALIIWPLIKGGYEYGIRITKEKKVYEIMLDDQMKPINKNDKTASELVEELKPEIIALFEKANSMWGIK